MRLMELKLFYVLAVNLASLASSQECDKSGVCDKNERCTAWQAEGKCSSNKEYMEANCPVSCGVAADSAANSSSTDKPDESAEPECKDNHSRCWRWAELGECYANPTDMNRHCALSCGVCGNEGGETNAIKECVDHEEQCNVWSDQGECFGNPRFMMLHCAKSCSSCEFQEWSEEEFPEVFANFITKRSQDFGVPQIAEGDERHLVVARLESTFKYIASDEVNNLAPNIRHQCQNRHKMCTFWQVVGECEANEAYMATDCAAACEFCHLTDEYRRCPPLPDQVPGLMPGDINQIFERTLRNAPGNMTELSESELKKTPRYTAHAHSRPSQESVREVSIVQDKSLPPWVITLDNFISDEEIEALIRFGHKHGFNSSDTTDGDANVDTGNNKNLSAKTSLCGASTGCRDDDVVSIVYERLSQLVNMPEENLEDLQLQKYEVGHFYETHHDYLPHQKKRQCGPKVLTFLLYLSDVEKGGETKFDELGVAVTPQKGRAVLWPNVLDSDPMEIDKRMSHGELPVEAGTKFVANGWFHMYDFAKASKKGCV
mmetsp:Transcript_34673/g.72155  ORF Transcript_34673/g.72155 Transcript_34673/m.72155 type:complete len:545 (-) Transcript_34673:417-2051(-)